MDGGSEIQLEVTVCPSAYTSMSSRFVGRLIVGFVLSLIFFIAYSSQIFIIWPWYGNELSVELIVLLLPFKSVSSVLSVFR